RVSHHQCNIDNKQNSLRGEYGHRWPYGELNAGLTVCGRSRRGFECGIGVEKKIIAALYVCRVIMVIHFAAVNVKAWDGIEGKYGDVVQDATQLATGVGKSGNTIG